MFGSEYRLIGSSFKSTFFGYFAADVSFLADFVKVFFAV